jgi:hypothetical protein
MRLTSFLVLGTAVGVVGTVGLAFFDVISVGPLNSKNLKGLFEQGVATTSGYTAATTPSEAMDKFQEAITKRQYKFAAKYCTKDYAEFLTRSHTAASQMGGDIDSIRNWGKKKGLLTDKVTLLLYRLDPFPTNFKVGPAPKEDSSKTKAYGSFLWDNSIFTFNPWTVSFGPEAQQIDMRMYQCVLVEPRTQFNRVELVKEGEEWKLNIPTNQQWNLNVNYFIDKQTTYHTGLDAMVQGLNNERVDSKARFEGDLLEKLRAAAK